MSTTEILSIVGVTVWTTLSAVCCWEPKISVGVALALLVATGIALAVGVEHLPEQLAIIAFYLLVSGVVLYVVQHVRKGVEDEGNLYHHG